MFESKLIKAGTQLMKAMDKTTSKHLPYKLAEIIKFHTKGAVASALASAWLPGVGSSAALVACAGFTWGMYLRINKELHISLSSNIVKTWAGGIITILGAYAVSMVAGAALSGVISFIPIIGSIGASAIMAGLCYAVTIVSGIVYLNLMTALFKAGRNPGNLSASELKDCATEIMDEMNISELLDEAKEAFSAAKEAGEFDDAEEDSFKICEKCGEAVDTDKRICPSCGARLK